MSAKPPKPVSLDQLDGPVLLVEDNAIVAIDTEENLRDLGIAEVLLAYDLDQAEDIIDNQKLSAAILDFNLADGNTAKLADKLIAKAVPFVFATGIAHTDDLPDRFASYTLLIKPFTEDDIAGALRSLVGIVDTGDAG